jgi:hypothetical protein
VCVHGEVVNKGEDGRLPMDLGQALDEIHQNVSPYLGHHVEGLQETGRLLGLGLVVLACAIGAHEVVYQVVSPGMKKSAHSRCSIFWHPRGPPNVPRGGPDDVGHGAQGQRCGSRGARGRHRRTMGRLARHPTAAGEDGNHRRRRLSRCGWCRGG